MRRYALVCSCIPAHNVNKIIIIFFYNCIIKVKIKIKQTKFHVKKNTFKKSMNIDYNDVLELKK